MLKIITEWVDVDYQIIISKNVVTQIVKENKYEIKRKRLMK
jgi:hypothetical protein